MNALRDFVACWSIAWGLIVAFLTPVRAADQGADHAMDATGIQPQHLVLDEHFRVPRDVHPILGFTAYGGDWKVEDGVLHAASGPGPKLIRDALTIATGDVGVEVMLDDNRAGNAALIVKVSDAAEGADRFNGYEVALDAQGQFLRLGRHRQNYEPIRDVPCPVPTGQWISLVVQMTENTLGVRVNGKKVLTYEDREHPLLTGSIGLRPWQHAAKYRNLWVKTGQQPQSIPLTRERADESAVIRPWHALRRGSATGSFAIQRSSESTEQQDQKLVYASGRGEFGVEHRGADGHGIPLAAGQPYHGFVVARCDEPVDLYVSTTTADGRVLAQAQLDCAAGPWQTIRFSLVPDQDETAGRVTIGLKSPGTVSLRRVLLEPGDWAWPDRLDVERLPPIILLTRHPLSAPPAVGQDLWAAQPRQPGCSIRIYDPSRGDELAKVIFQDPDGCIYDMNTTPDAQTLLFSYRRRDEAHWHIWRIGTDGTGLQQLTDGPYYDVSPCPLPDGDIMFVSTRRFGYTLCQPGPASNLHRMAPDGSDIRCVSMNTLSDMSPQMLPDGRVLFTRWEYIDRDLTYRQSLWTQSPNGRAYQLFFGNTVRDVGTFWQARPLPGRTDRVVATFAPHHGFPHGAIGLIDREAGPEGPKGAGFRYITQEFPAIGDQRREWAYRDPYPIDDHSLLCSYGGGGVNRYRIYVLSDDDRKRLLYEDATQGCYYPMLLRPRPTPPLISQPGPASQAGVASAPAESIEAEPMGTLVLADVYRGLEPTIQRGRVKALRIMEQVRKTEDLRARAFDQSPVMSYGTYYAKRNWGTVPIEEDGSAHFQVPALREIYFQVLDAEGRELQRMTSAMQVMPGERATCIGCHEPRQSPPPAGSSTPLAAHRPPHLPERPTWNTNGMVDFLTVVQPVLDRHCISCHSGGAPAGGCDLTGDKTRYFNMAYDNLLGRSQSYRQHDMDSGEMLATELARGRPLVHFYWLLRTPTAVNQPLWSGSHASRLTEIVESDHYGCEIPPEDRRRIYLWIDANVPYYATYAHSRPHSPGRRDLWTDVETGQLSEWFTRDFLEVYQRRCQTCHGDLNSTTDWQGRFAWINLSNPANSPALTAHLAEYAGGRGLVTDEGGQRVPIFESTDEADYAQMLRAIEMGCRLARETLRADDLGFDGHREEP